MMDAMVAPCACGDPDPAGCMYLDAGYPWCRSCREHHRPPECAVNQAGQSLAPCGCTWDRFDSGQPCPHFERA